MIAHGKHHSPGNRKRPQLGPSKSFASVHIDNSTSLDPYKDGQNLFKRQIIILLLPNYFNRLGGVGGVGGGIPYPGLTPGLTPGFNPGIIPGAFNPGYFGGSQSGIFRTGGITAGSAASPGGAMIPTGNRGYRKPASFQV
ncbi:hypothetical protein TYRP_010013 [Tyrophagus putrescentiae]|nr:hypothetical protein TYRP_010013 [Tyrophagus putrescentiae]